jgi:hypothetical protein
LAIKPATSLACPTANTFLSTPPNSIHSAPKRQLPQGDYAFAPWISPSSLHALVHPFLNVQLCNLHEWQECRHRIDCPLPIRFLHSFSNFTPFLNFVQ